MTLKTIADLASVSRGTVDRVLYNRKGVSPGVRERVRKIAEAMDYRPNMLGKGLVNLNKTIKIRILLAPDENPFVDEIKRGIRRAADDLADFGVELRSEVVQNLEPEEQLRLLDSLGEISGLALVPIEDPRVRDRINSLIDAGIPVVTYNSDILGTRRICFVGQDHLAGGRTAGDLLGKLLGGNGKVAVITSSHNLLCHQQRCCGFEQKLKEKYPSIEIVAIRENEDKSDLAFAITGEILESVKELRGIYITGGGVGGLSKALQAAGAAHHVRVVSHDFVPETLDLLRTGVIDFTIGQDPFNQGYLPARILFDYLATHKLPESEFVRTRIDIRTGENLEPTP